MAVHRHELRDGQGHWINAAHAYKCDFVLDLLTFQLEGVQVTPNMLEGVLTAVNMKLQEQAPVFTPCSAAELFFYSQTKYQITKSKRYWEFRYLFAEVAEKELLAEILREESGSCQEHQLLSNLTNVRSFLHSNGIKTYIEGKHLYTH